MSTTFYLVLNLQLGSTAIGIQTPGGVVLAVEKRVTSPLIVPASIEKIMEIDEHIGMLVSIVSLLFLICAIHKYSAYSTIITLGM